MPFYFDVTREGETRAFPSGPFESEAEAEASKTLRSTDLPNDTHGDVYEAADDHMSTMPCVTAIVSHDGVDYKVWSDGVEEPA